MAVTLVLFKKDGIRKDIPLHTHDTVIGRQPDCDVRIPLHFVSRKHCRITQDEGRTLVEDLGSSNGTFLNSEKVAQAVVSAGDRLSIGSLTFTVQINGEPFEVTPPLKKRKKEPVPAAQVAQAAPPRSHGDPSHASATEAFDPLLDDEIAQLLEDSGDLDPLTDSKI